MLRIALYPTCFESHGILPPALKTGPVTRGKGSSLIQKEQFRPAVGGHYRPMPPLELKNTGDPGFYLKGPANGLMLVVDYPTVAHPGAARRSSKNIPKRIDPVLKHDAIYEPNSS
jgi:hypothetical protein